MAYENLLHLLAVLACIIFIALTARSFLKKESVARGLALGGMSIAFIIVALAIQSPGSESRFEMGPVKYSLKPSPKVGSNENIFSARNTDDRNPQTVTVSTASGDLTISPALKILSGKEYITKIISTKDGKERTYRMILPPGAEFESATPSVVTFDVQSNAQKGKEQQKRIWEIFAPKKTK